MPMAETNSRRAAPSLAIAKRLRAILSEVMTTTQIAKELGVAVSTAQRYCNHGEFPNATKIGHEHLVPIEDVMDYKNRRLGKRGRPRLQEVRHG